MFFIFIYIYSQIKNLKFILLTVFVEDTGKQDGR